jgi:hypothetical protein
MHDLERERKRERERERERERACTCVCVHTYFLGKALFETLFQIMLTPDFQLPDFS